VEKEGWELVPGDYNVFVSGSPRDTPLVATVRLSPAVQLFRDKK
jgi:hypothetical protein